MTGLIFTLLFFVVIHKDIKRLDLDFKYLLLRILFALCLVTFVVYSPDQNYFHEHNNLLFYVLIWVLVCSSFLIHWVYKKNKSHKNIE